jgi:hypothetical protein
MFSASAAIDHLNNRGNNLITIYHQTCAIRLLNESLSQKTPVLNYGTLGSVIPLILCNVRNPAFDNRPVKCFPLKSVADEDLDDGAGQSFCDGSSKGPREDAITHPKASEGWDRTTTWGNKTVSNTIFGCFYCST